MKAVHVITRQSQPDDVKKEAAKMLKKINEVAERSENLENQVYLHRYIHLGLDNFPASLACLWKSKGVGDPD